MKTIDDPNSPLHGMLISSLPADVYQEALHSADDIGVLLRSYSLVELACKNLCDTLYHDYKMLQHDSLSKHLRGLRAIGFFTPTMRMVDAINKHRGPSAHVRNRIISREQVDELNSQSSGMYGIPGTLLEIGRFQQTDGSHVVARAASLRVQYAILGMACATAIDFMAEKRKPLAS